MSSDHQPICDLRLCPCRIGRVEAGDLSHQPGGCGPICERHYKARHQWWRSVGVVSVIGPMASSDAIDQSVRSVTTGCGRKIASSDPSRNP
jgi:hypothetical protein